ncbi:MAG TPA: PLP-dependent aminotransferase family protein [Planctomycetaceae bacterium]|nr:PLP-dependent aminotransferase family protein [Planctomycetaceae bacterium]
MSHDAQPRSNIPELRLSQRWRWASKQAISFLMQQAVENPGVISLAAGLVDPDSLPVPETLAAAQTLLADDRLARQALQYGTTAGAERLRRVLLGHFARLEGQPAEALGVDAGQIVLTTGSQQLLSLVGEVLLDPGDICLVAAPTYFVFLGVLNGLGAQAVPVPADDDGLRVDLLERELEQLDAEGQHDRVTLIYTVSYYKNPSGISLAAGRRRELVEIARRWSRGQRLMILEDAAYRELRYDGPDLPSVWSFDREFVIYAQTFSKSFSPGLRVGYGVLPRELVAPVCDRKGNEDFGSANFNQHLLATVFEQGLYEDHVNHVRASCRRKRDAMLAAAERHFAGLPGVSWVQPHGGLYVWMRLPEAVNTSFDSLLFTRAVQVEKVMYVPGELFYAGPANRRHRNELRLSFGVQPVEGIAAGMERLARAVRSVL